MNRCSVTRRYLKQLPSIISCNLFENFTAVVKFDILYRFYCEIQRTSIVGNGIHSCNRMLFNIPVQLCMNSERNFSSYFLTSVKSYSTTSLSLESKTEARKLQKQFQCTLKEANNFITSNIKLFQEDNFSDIIEKCKFIEKFGISKSTIKNNPWLLKFSTDELEEKFGLLEKWNFNSISSGVYLLKLSLRRLKFLTEHTLHEMETQPELVNSNRISYLSKLLQADELVVGELAYNRPFLLTMRFSKMKDTLKTVLAYGMSPAYLLNDIWVVKFNLDDIKSRLQLLQASVDESELRPWMLHCPMSVLMRSVELRDENRAALEPFTNSSEYLSSRLEINPDIVKSVIKKHPPVQQVQVHKLKEILDFLFSEGFTPLQVCSSPRILCHSLSTIKERSRILQKHGYRPVSLLTICKTKKQFTEFIAKLKHSDRFSKRMT